MRYSKFYIFESGQNDLNQYIKQRFDYFLKVNNTDVEISLVSDLSIQLFDNEAIVLFVDSVKLVSLIENKHIEYIFSNNSIKRNQIILLLFGVEVNNLPDYMRKSVILSYPLSDADGSSSVLQLKSSGDKWQINNSVFDLVHYCFPKNNENSSKVFVGPYDGNAKNEFLKVKRELTQRGYNVIDFNFIQDYSDKNHLNNILKEVDTSIHFISHESLKDYPDKENDSLAVNSRISELCKTDANINLKRIIYIPPILPETTDDISHKVDIFKRDTKILKNAEIIQSPIERLKGIVLDYLGEVNSSLSRMDTQSDIYFIFSLQDKDEAMDIIEEIKDKGLKVCYPDFSLSRLDLLSYHQKCLVNCKGVMIFNKNNNKWLSRKVNDVLKAPGWGRERPIEIKYLCGNEVDDSILKNPHIKSYQYISDFADKAFLDKIESID